MPQNPGPLRLDSIDRTILRLLQQDGRLTNAELAKRVRLSPSPCLRRVRALEQAGYITGYAAVLDRVRGVSPARPADLASAPGTPGDGARGGAR